MRLISPVDDLPVWHAGNADQAVVLHDSGLHSRRRREESTRIFGIHAVVDFD